MRTFRAQAPIWDDSIWLLIGDSDERGQLVGYVVEMTFKAHTPGDHIADPSLKLRKPEAQALIDALWGAGVRPSSGEGNAGQLGATEKHLEDMRRLVFERGPFGSGAVAVEVGHEPGYESHTAILCVECLERAARLAASSHGKGAIR